MKCIHAIKIAKRQEEVKEKGNTYLNQEKLHEAIEQYTFALTIDPLNSKFNSIIYANRGLAY